MTTLVPRVGVAALSSPAEVGADRAAKAAADLSQLLAQNGCEVVAAGAVGSPDRAAAAGREFAEVRLHAVALAPASWFEDYLVLDLIEECDVPILFWPLPGMETGALCGTQQATSYLKQLGRPALTVFDPIQPGPCLASGLSFLRAAALHHQLRRARIGMAGHRVRGMTEISANEMALKKSIGPRVVPVDMVGLFREAKAADLDGRQRVWSEVKSAASRVQVADEAGLDAAGMCLAIKAAVAREGLCALAFGCYPDYMGCACLAASLLAGEGIAVGCEGDVNSTVGMVMLSLLTGQPTHNTDWLDPVDDGSVVFTHCGSGAHALAAKREDVTLAPVRLANQGVCSLFPAKPGSVTLLNLMPLGDRYQMAVMEGEALPVHMVFPGNPLRVRFPVSARSLIDWIHDEGIGHHWVAGYGHVAGELRDWSRIAGPGVRLVECRA